MRSSDLPQKIALQIVQDIRTGELRSGDHLRSQGLAARFGVSRTPIREALTLLTNRGYLEQQKNRGFFVRAVLPDPTRDLEDEDEIESLDDYQRLAEEWLTDRLPEKVTELFLRETYQLTKSRLNEILMRAVREGWAERKPGYGWRFLPVAKTPESFDQIYRFRMVIEPAALLEPSFRLEREALAEQKRIHLRMLDMDMSKVPGEQLLATGSLFHEQLIKMSGNPFYFLALERVNRMRRLMEYRAKIDRARFQSQCSEHIEIIECVEAGDTVQASFKMRTHLSGALRRKSPLAWGWAATLD